MRQFAPVVGETGFANRRAGERAAVLPYGADVVNPEQSFDPKSTMEVLMVRTISKRFSRSVFRKIAGSTLTTLVLLSGSVLVAGSADAAGSVTVRGEITCINNASPVGVWVTGENSTSGWAKTAVPIELGGQSKVTYQYTLNRGGRYKVTVGCGGSSQHWGKSLSSGYLSGVANNLKCNDVNPVLKWFGKKLFRVDVTQGVKYLTCAKA